MENSIHFYRKGQEDGREIKRFHPLLVEDFQRGAANKLAIARMRGNAHNAAFELGRLRELKTSPKNPFL